jgi:hypothetical protein
VSAHGIRVRILMALRCVLQFGRGVRAAEGDGLENRCWLKPTVGSNPTPSAQSKGPADAGPLRVQVITGAGQVRPHR